MRIGARKYVYERGRKNISGISSISRRKNGVGIGASKRRCTEWNGCGL